MNYFELNEKINQQKELTIQTRSILNQLLSYTLNNTSFYGTNQYLSDYWGFSLRTVNNVMKDLKNLGLIQSSTIRKKHTKGGKTWYNKRYIKVDVDTLIQYLDNVKVTQIEQPKEVEIIPTETNNTIITNEPIDFLEDQESIFKNGDLEAIANGNAEYIDGKVVYLEQPEVNLKTTSIAYDHECVLQLAKISPDIDATIKKKFPDGVPSEDYTNGFYHYIIVKNSGLMEKYTAIMSNNLIPS